MIKKESRIFEVHNRKYFLVLMFVILGLVLMAIFSTKNSIFNNISLYVATSLMMLMLFIRIDSRPIAYFWIKKNRISKYILLDIKGDYVPLRFFISHLYFYVQLMIGVALYLFIMNSSLKDTINIETFTYWLITVLNINAFIAFVVVEVIEYRKCKDIKL